MLQRMGVFKSAGRFTIAAAFLLAAAIFLAPASSSAQGLEVSGGWTHITQDFGMDGFSLSAAWYMAPRISVFASYDGAWDTTDLGSFQFTDVGAIDVKSHIQDFLIGPRVFFAPYRIDRRNRIIPFAEARFGVSHLHQKVQEGITPAAINQDSAFSWLLGGGVDYPLASHWVARGDLGLLRTHLDGSAQSRLRLAITLVYTFGARGRG